jgi:hypothetical protein
MPSALLLAGAVPAVLAAYVCLLGPGQAWWRRQSSAVPTLLARVALSTVWTSVLGLGLAAAGAFSLPRIIVINGIVTLAGYLVVARVRLVGLEAPSAPRRGVIVCVIALLLYWPPYETHFAASDSTTYTDGGLYLARAHHLYKEDPLLAKLPKIARARLFPSALGQPGKAPYSRIPGGMVIDSLDSDVVRPSFFPLPVVWAALFADGAGGRYAGGYTPLFAALAVWATWVFVRARLGLLASLGATALVALNAANYWAGRVPLSEPLAWFFLWAGLVALDAWEQEGFPRDARLAALLLGAAGLARVEMLVFLAAALAVRRLLRASLMARPLTPGFYATFSLMAAATLLEARLFHGAHTAPISDALAGTVYRLEAAWQSSPAGIVVVVVALLAVGLLLVRQFRLSDAMLAAAVTAMVVVYTVFASHPQALRSLRWLGAYVGWPTLLLAACGLALMWRRRLGRPSNGFVVLLALLVGGLLIYNPHVIPSMPWASRRFVPLVVPVLLVSASIVADLAWRRRRWAGVLVWAVLLASALLPARDLWGRSYYEGTYDQLAEFNSVLPAGGTLLIDYRLVGLALGVPLWLAYDRDNLPVYVASKAGARLAAGTTYTLDKAGAGPVYLIKPALNEDKPIPMVQTVPVTSFTFQVRLPEMTAAEPPHVLQRYTQPVSIFELRPWNRAPKAATAPALPRVPSPR